MAKKELAIRDSGKLAKKGDIRNDLARYAKDQAAAEPSGAGNSISIKGKKFRFKGDTLSDPLKVIILDYAYVNKFYTGKYDEENPQPPACFALAKAEGELTPHETSPDQQSENCKECPNNAFGSADVGRGKACKNSRRLVVINADVKELNATYIKNADVAYIELPPKSLGHFRGYLKKVTEGLKIPLFAVVTALSFDDEDDYPVVVPQFEDELGNDRGLLNAILAKRDEVQSDLLAPPDVSNYAAEPVKRKSERKKAKEPVATGKNRSKF